MDDWRAAIAKYDADVASGRIAFADGSKFATTYQDQDKQDQSLAEHVLDNVDN